jgi:hypothetical protein
MVELIACKSPAASSNGFTGPFGVLCLARYGALALNPSHPFPMVEKLDAPSYAYRRGSVASGSDPLETAGRSTELRARGEPIVQMLWLVEHTRLAAEVCSCVSDQETRRQSCLLEHCCNATSLQGQQYVPLRGGVKT